MKRYLLLAILISACATTQKPEPMSVAGSYLEQGLLREAIQEYRDILEKNPSNLSARKRLGYALFRAGAYEEAIEHLASTFPDSKDSVKANFILGEAFRILKDYNKAFYYLQEALNLDPYNYKIIRSLAWTHWKVQEFDMAAQLAKIAYKMEPRSEHSRIILLRAYVQLKRFDEAQDLLEERKWSEKNHAIMESLQGDIYLGRGLIEKAKVAYNSAIEKNPLLPSALLGLGLCMKTKQSPKSESMISKAIAINSGLVAPSKDESDPILEDLLEEEI